MGGIGHAISKGFKSITKGVGKVVGGILGAGSSASVNYVQDAGGAMSAPAGDSAERGATETNTAKKKRRGKKSLMVSQTTNTGGSSGGSGLNI